MVFCSDIVCPLLSLRRYCFCWGHRVRESISRLYAADSSQPDCCKLILLGQLRNTAHTPSRYSCNHAHHPTPQDTASFTPTLHFRAPTCPHGLPNIPSLPDPTPQTQLDQPTSTFLDRPVPLPGLHAEMTCACRDRHCWIQKTRRGFFTIVQGFSNTMFRRNTV